MATAEEKREIVFNAALDVFGRLGFRGTAMNDIADAAGISRPALYLLFANKEDLFRQLALQRQEIAIAAVVDKLGEPGPFAARFTEAVLAYERLFFEPVFESRHGEELIDVNISIAGDDMRRGIARLHAHLVAALEDAAVRGEVRFARGAANAREFVDLFWSSISGQKKSAASIADFRRRVATLTSVFLTSITPGGST